MILVSRTLRFAPALVLLLGLFTAPSADALNVCGYRAKGALGFQCPVHTGATVCLTVNAITGHDCENTLMCFGGLLCQVKLVPFTGPQKTCPFESTRLRGFSCFAPIRFPTRGPTNTPTSTPTSTEIPFTPTGTPAGTATATITATVAPPATATDTAAPPATLTSTAVPAPTSTDTVAPAATSTSTAVPAATSTNTAVVQPATATSTATQAQATATGTATGTAAATVTATHTVAGATSTATVAVATATATSTNVPGATATNTVPANTATATKTNVPATGTATNTVPANTATATKTNAPSTATATNTVPGATATATKTNVPATATATSTAPAATATATATSTAGPVCGIASAGRYTQTTTGGVLKVSTFLPFQFPAGGATIQDVSAPNPSTCVSNTVVPYPGGLTVPVFCVPALGYTVQVSQTGCGVGVIDSNGGSDLTTTEKGDTSFTSAGCAASQSCAVFVDSSGEIDITVGDGTPDTCAAGSSGNAMVSIPVNTVTWLSSNGCPDSDMNPDGADDTIITQFPQTLDLTTDRAIAQYNDNDGDTCSLKGAGPAGPYTQNQMCFAAGNPYACCTGSGTGTCVGNGAVGACINFTSNAVSVAGGGTVFSSAAPLHDLLFTTVQPANIAGPTTFGGATCASPPTINFSGLAQRCIIAP